MTAGHLSVALPQDTAASLAPRFAGRLFLKVSEVAELTDTDSRTVRRAIELGQIQARHIGTTIRVPAAPFWLLCGLDPHTLRAPTPRDQSGPEDNSEAGPTRTDLDDTTPATGARHATFSVPRTG